MVSIHTKHLIVFLKAPLPGKVKTRLACDVGPERAVLLYRAMTADLLNNIISPRYHIQYYFDTLDRPDIINYPGIHNKDLHLQSGADLGEKMCNALAASFHAGAESALLIGSDIPYLDADILVHYFHNLDNADMAIGPAFDGGYYCIGFKRNRLHPSLFSHIIWSTPTVYEMTLQKAAFRELRVYTGPCLRDIDTGKDLAIVLQDRDLAVKIPMVVKASEGVNNF